MAVFSRKPLRLIRDAGALGGSANGLIGNPDTLSSNLVALSFDPDGLSFDPEALSFNPDALSFDPETLSFDVGALIFDVPSRESNCKSLISSNLRINPQNHLKKEIKFGKPTGWDEGARRRAILTWGHPGRAQQTVPGIQMAAFSRKPLRGNPNAAGATCRAEIK